MRNKPLLPFCLVEQALQQRAKERVRQQLEEDKLNRALRFQSANVQPTAGTAAAIHPSTAAAAVAAGLSLPTASSNSTAQLQIRLPTGGSIKLEYPSETLLRTVHEAVLAELSPDAQITLVMPRPHHVRTL